jgi:molybdopterin molybdotransferase
LRIRLKTAFTIRFVLGFVPAGLIFCTGHPDHEFCPSHPAAPARAPLKPLDTALAELLARAEPLPGIEAVSTFDADGRVLAQDLASSLDVPAHDNSSMDGYALRVADWAEGAVLQVNQRIPAGSSGHALARTPRRAFSPARPSPPAPMRW